MSIVLVLYIGWLLSGTHVAEAGTDGFGLGLDQLVPGSTSTDGSHSPWQQSPGPTDWFDPPAFDAASYPKRLGYDLKALVLAPVDWQGSDWRKLGLGLAVVGLASLADEPINTWVDENRTGSWISAAEAIRPLGQEGAFVLLGATWLIGRNYDKPELVAVAEDGLEAALLAAGVITPMIKVISGRTRPRNTGDHGQFGGSGHSFPSGETTLAFAVASVVAAHSDSAWVDASAWTVAGLIGLQRIVLDGHWSSDVAAGALIGAAVGGWVVNRNHPERGKKFRATAMPLVSEDSYGFTVHMSF